MLSNVADLTVPEKILLAASQLDQQGHSPFSAEALIVAAWQQFPQQFGLKGYADQYPDSNKILSSIMGDRGITRRGWLTKMGQKLYSLSREGKVAVRRLQNPDEGEVIPAEVAPAAARLRPDLEKALTFLLDSSAVQKFEEGRKAELTFADACRFWDVTESLRGDALDERLQKFEVRLLDLERLIATREIELSNGRSVSPAEVRVLGDLHAHMEARFSRHLNVLRSRGQGR